VLIDELDKAPRDLPNDLLRELEDMTFEIKELGVRIRVPKNAEGLPQVRPIVVITSNSERSLPEPFLRRVAFYDISPPSDDKLRQIVQLRFTEVDKPDAVEKSIALFRRIVEAFPTGERAPGMAEFLAWFSYLHKRGLGKQKSDPREMPDAVEASLVILAKTKEALNSARDVFDEKKTQIARAP
jgi:MoxR-like ATPase